MFRLQIKRIIRCTSLHRWVRFVFLLCELQSFKKIYILFLYIADICDKIFIYT